MDPAQRPLRVAFFGGSFDPPHLGHLAVARAARSALALDTVLFAPVGAQPLKPLGATASFDDRLAMTRLAVAGEPGFEVSLSDAPTGGQPNYSIDTLKELCGSLPPQSELFCLMGADSYFSLRQWHRAADIPFAAEMVVASRPGELLVDLSAALPDGLTMESVGTGIFGGVDLLVFAISDVAGRNARLFLMPGLDVEISATEIREQINKDATSGKNDLVPKAVAEYIRTHGLYR